MAKPNKTYTVGEEERIDAVDRYPKGERPFKICKSLGRSRVWSRKWIGRYNDSEKSSKTEWFRDESRAPKNVHRKMDSGTEQLVITVRKSLIRQISRAFPSKNRKQYPKFGYFLLFSDYCDF